MDKKVSIIIPTYNRFEYLLKAVQSVKNQTYKNWELIFWDNQSVDKSAEIFKNFDDPRFKYFSAPEHTLLSKAQKIWYTTVYCPYLVFILKIYYLFSIFFKKSLLHKHFHVFLLNGMKGR